MEELYKLCPNLRHNEPRPITLTLTEEESHELLTIIADKCLLLSCDVFSLAEAPKYQKQLDTALALKQRLMEIIVPGAA
jgi:hypothetical protein